MDFLHSAFKFIFDFVVMGVIVKIIVGHWLADRILEYGNRFYKSANRNIRSKAIWDHFQLRAAGEGHQHSNILACREGQCASL